MADLPVFRPHGPLTTEGTYAEADPYDLVHYTANVLKYVDAAVQEGEAVLQAEPAWSEMDKSIGFIMGDQLDPMRPEGLANFVDNRTKHIILQTASALTDIRPLFGFK